MTLPLGFKPIDLELLEALPEGSIVYLYDNGTQMITTHTVNIWDGELVLSEIMSGIGYRQSDILRCDGYALPSDLFPPIPYGEWLTGNVELLESLPINTRILASKLVSPIPNFESDLWKEKDRLWKNRREVYTSAELVELFRYNILRPIPTE